MTQQDRKLTASEVAKRLDVTSETVRDWARTGKLRTMRLPSGRMKFWESDVVAIERGDVDAA